MPLTPKQSADDALSRARAILTYSQDYELPDGVEDDLVRTALTMGVAALDTYMNAAVMRTVKAWKPTASLAKLEVRFDALCELVDTAVEDRRKNAKSRPWVRVKETLQERLLRVTFQSSRSIEDGMAMCGVNKGWNKIAAQRGIGAKSLKKRLDEIVHRRNKIVHESDLLRESRPREIKRAAIDAARVKRDLNWIERLIEAIDTVVAP